MDGDAEEHVEWDGVSWNERVVAAPSARGGHAMAALEDKLVLFGGGTLIGELGDTWTWNGTSWLQVSSTGPSARSGHSMSTF